jgi:hypothetical protein
MFARRRVEQLGIAFQEFCKSLQVLLGVLKQLLAKCEALEPIWPGYMSSHVRGELDVDLTLRE